MQFQDQITNFYINTTLFQFIIHSIQFEPHTKLLTRECNVIIASFLGLKRSSYVFHIVCHLHRARSSSPPSLTVIPITASSQTANVSPQDAPILQSRFSIGHPSPFELSSGQPNRLRTFRTFLGITSAETNIIWSKMRP